MDCFSDIIPIKEQLILGILRDLILQSRDFQSLNGDPSYKIKEFKGNLTDWESKTKCNLKSESEILKFVEKYTVLTNEFIKLKPRKGTIKDTILKTQIKYNIIMLIKKLMENFDDHFKLRLLSVADRSFDGIYSSRFKGTFPCSLIGEITQIWRYSF